MYSGRDDPPPGDWRQRVPKREWDDDPGRADVKRRRPFSDGPGPAPPPGPARFPRRDFGVGGGAGPGGFRPGPRMQRGPPFGRPEDEYEGEFRREELYRSYGRPGRDDWRDDRKDSPSMYSPGRRDGLGSYRPISGGSSPRGQQCVVVLMKEGRSHPYCGDCVLLAEMDQRPVSLSVVVIAIACRRMKRASFPTTRATCATCGVHPRRPRRRPPPHRRSTAPRPRPADRC
jgi:ribosomal protein L37E